MNIVETSPNPSRKYSLVSSKLHQSTTPAQSTPPSLHSFTCITMSVRCSGACISSVMCSSTSTPSCRHNMQSALRETKLCDHMIHAGTHYCAHKFIPSENECCIKYMTCSSHATAPGWATRDWLPFQAIVSESLLMS